MNAAFLKLSSGFPLCGGGLLSMHPQPGPCLPAHWRTAHSGPLPPSGSQPAQPQQESRLKHLIMLRDRNVAKISHPTGQKESNETQHLARFRGQVMYYQVQLLSRTQEAFKLWRQDQFMCLCSQQQSTIQHRWLRDVHHSTVHAPLLPINIK